MDTTNNAVKREAMEEVDNKVVAFKVVAFRLNQIEYCEFRDFMESHGSTVSQGIRLAIKQALSDRVRFLLDGETAP